MHTKNVIPPKCKAKYCLKALKGIRKYYQTFFFKYNFFIKC